MYPYVRLVTNFVFFTCTTSLPKNTLSTYYDSILFYDNYKQDFLVSIQKKKNFQFSSSNAEYFLSNRVFAVAHILVYVNSLYNNTRKRRWECQFKSDVWIKINEYFGERCKLRSRQANTAHNKCYICIDSRSRSITSEQQNICSSCTV